MRCEYNLSKQVKPRVLIIKDNKDYGFIRNTEIFINGSSYVNEKGEWICDFGCLNEYFELYIKEKVYTPNDFEIVYFCYEHMKGSILLKSNIKNKGYQGLILKYFKEEKCLNSKR